MTEKLQARAVWLKSLPSEVRLNTELVDSLRKALADNSPAHVASYLATCLQKRVWEAVADFSWDNPKIVSYEPLEWIRSVLCLEPDELMRVVASPLPDSQDGASAATELIHIVKAYEPESFSILLDPANPRNWRELLRGNEKREGGPWIKAYAELDTARSSGNHGPVDHDLLNKARDLYRVHRSQQKVSEILGVKRSTLASWLNGSKTPRVTNSVISHAGSKITYRDKIRRRLQRLVVDPALCRAQGTTQDKVKAALAAFLSGSPAAVCLRQAGLADQSRERRNRIRAIRIAGEPTDVARRIIDKVKPVAARAIAEQIICQLNLAS